MGDERPVLGVTMGDASGAGPEIVVKALTLPHVRAVCRPVVVGDAATFRQAARIVGSDVPIRPINRASEAHFSDDAIEVLDHTNNIVGRVDEATAKVQGIGQALSDVEAEGRADVRAGSGPAGRIDVSVDLYPDRYKDSFWRVGARDLGGDEMLDLQYGLPLGHRDERFRVGIMENELGVGWDRRWSERLHSEVELLNPDAFRLDLKGRYRYDRDWDLIFGMDRVLSGTEPFAGARYNFDF